MCGMCVCVCVCVCRNRVAHTMPPHPHAPEAARVPVCEAARVHVLERVNQLREVTERLRLREFSVLVDVLEQVRAARIGHHYGERALRV